MARIQDIDIPYLEFAEAAAPGTPAAAVSRLYVKADGLFYSKDDAGVETLVSGGLAAAHTFSGVKVRESTPQSITYNANTVLLFNEEDFDTAAYHDNVTNTGRLTVPSGAGNNKKYAVGANAGITAAAGGQRQLVLRLDGTTSIASVTDSAPNTGAHTHLHVSTIIELDEAQYVEVIYFQNQTAAAALDIVGVPTFWMYRLEA